MTMEPLGTQLNLIQNVEEPFLGTLWVNVQAPRLAGKEGAF